MVLPGELQLSGFGVRSKSVHVAPCDGKRRRRCPRCWRRGSPESPPGRISKGQELQDVEMAVQKEHNLALGRNSETLAVDSRQVRVYPGKQPPVVRINSNMSSKKLAKNKPRTTNYEDFTNEGTLSVDENFSLELRTPVSSPVDHEPFITIEYDDCYIQQDPLTVDDSAESNTPSLGDNYYGYGNITIYDPFSNYRKGVGLSRDDNNLKRKGADQLSEMEPIKAKSKKMNEVGHVRHQAAGTQTEHVEIVNQDTVSDPVQSRLEDDDVMYVQDDADILSKLAQQVQQKTKERIRAANELKQKRKAENAMAKQLVREILKPDSQQDRNSPPVERMTPKQRRDAANAESAMARKLILQMTKGYSLEQIIQELKSTASSAQSPPADFTSRENRANSYGQPEANEETQGNQRIPTPSVPKQIIQQNLQNFMSTGYSLQQIVRNSKSAAPSSNLRPADSTNRENRSNTGDSSAAKEVTQRPQRMEEDEGWTRICDPWAPSVPDKRIQRKSSTDSLACALLPATSSSAVTTLQPLPVYAQAFTWRAGQGSASTRGIIAEEPIQSEPMFSIPQQSFPVYEQRSSRFGEGSQQIIPRSNTSQSHHPPYQPPCLMPTASLHSGVHPSHLLPPSLVKDETDECAIECSLVE